MKEKIYNIYIDMVDEIIERIGIVEYICDGSDEEKKNILKRNSLVDLHKANYYKLPENYIIENEAGTRKGKLSFQSYVNLMQLGKVEQFIIDVIKDYNFPDFPLFCITPVVNGDIKIESESDLYINNESNPKIINILRPPDYLNSYLRENVFHITELINDDFFKGIKLLSNNKFYTQAIKLLFSSIDTFAFLEYGDIQNNFKIWVKKFIDLTALNVTEDELWELRNSLLHMTNYESRKVIQGKVNSITIIIGKELFNPDPNFKTINYMDFIFEVNKGVLKWTDLLFSDMDKFQNFLNRYDTIISDSRYHIIEMKNE